MEENAVVRHSSTAIRNRNLRRSIGEPVPPTKFADARTDLHRSDDYEVARLAAAEVRYLRERFIRGEFDLAMTFLDGAILAGRPEARLKCIKDAIAALTVVNKFLNAEPRIHAKGLFQRQEKLRQRLREVTGVRSAHVDGVAALDSDFPSRR